VFRSHDFSHLQCTPAHARRPVVQASLAQYRDRYHDLLNKEMALSVRIALRNDLKPLTVKTPEQVAATMTAAGLPQCIDPEVEPPALPFRAPFSAALPSVRGCCSCCVLHCVQACFASAECIKFHSAMSAHADPAVQIYKSTICDS
jgi:hypothetical protein